MRWEMDYKGDVLGKSNIIIYTTEDGLSKIETTFDGDTVWLSIDQMAELFQRDRSVIGKHVRNIFKKGELRKEAVWAKFAYTASDGKKYNVDYYNLDVIISVGYRVKSKRGTQFRIWATGILKEYMRKGSALDDERLKNLGGGSYLYKGRCRKGIYGAHYICRKPADFAGSCHRQKLFERKRTSCNGAACVRVFGFCRTSGAAGTDYDHEGLGRTFRPYSDNERRAAIIWKWKRDA